MPASTAAKPVAQKPAPASNPKTEARRALQMSMDRRQ
jgi:hypothetical protein